MLHYRYASRPVAADAPVVVTAPQVVYRDAPVRCRDSTAVQYPDGRPRYPTRA